MPTVTRPTVSGNPKRTVYDVVTDRIVGLLESGVVPWRQPWANVGHPKNLVSDRDYRGVNVFILSAASYSTPYWLTYKQAKDKGGNVRKGERGFPVVFWKWIDDEPADSPIVTPKGQVKARCFARYYTVFNVSQCDGVESPPMPERVPVDPIPVCDRTVANMPKCPPIGHGGNRACYFPAEDRVQMPDRDQFRSAPAYYSVLFHELTHATSHDSRCARKNLGDWSPFGSADYSKEELVAEMGAAFLCAETGIEPATLDNSASYIASWLRRLRNDPKLVVHAAAQAQKAADFILDRKGVTA